MSLRMHYYNDPVLRKKCDPVEKFDASTEKLVQEMIALMKKQDNEQTFSVGIAAPQAGVSKRVFIVRLFEQDKEGKIEVLEPKAYINPVISNPSKETEIIKEGCLSLPGIQLDIERPISIHVKAQDPKGDFFEEDLTGYAARVVVHENDHINGKLFIDRISKEERKEIEEKLLHLKKHYPQK